MKRETLSTLASGAGVLLGFGIVGLIGCAVMTAYVKVGFNIVMFVWERL